MRGAIKSGRSMKRAMRIMSAVVRVRVSAGLRLPSVSSCTSSSSTSVSRDASDLKNCIICTPSVEEVWRRHGHYTHFAKRIVPAHSPLTTVKILLHPLTDRSSHFSQA